MVRINEEFLNKKQACCTARTITFAEAHEALKAYTEKLGISKKALIGSEITDCDLNAQSFPSAYKYCPDSTHFSAIYKTTGWVITNFWRDRTNAPSKKIVAKLSDSAKQALIDRFETIAR